MFKQKPNRILRMMLVVAAAGLLRGQETPQPAGSAVQPGRGSPTFTLRTGTNLVIVDVVVSGADGRPVHGLKASDFSLNEDRAPQRIRNFQEHLEAGPTSRTAPKSKAGSL